MPVTIVAVWMREHRLVAASAILLLGLAWSTAAHAGASVSPSTLATPATAVGVESGPATGTMSRTETSGNPNYTLVLGACSTTNGGDGAFSFPASVSLGSPVSVSVTYTPSAPGDRTCTINIRDNSNALAGTFTVTGSGQRLQMIEIGSISRFPAVRAFDGAIAAHTSTRTLEVFNRGDRTLTITNVTFSTPQYSIDPSSIHQTSTTIDGNSSKTWTLRFNPAAIGVDISGVVTFHNDTPGNTMATRNLIGNGTSGDYASSGGAEIDFGTVPAGSSAGRDIELSHTGVTPRGTLTITSVQIVHDDVTKPWFSVSAQPSTLTNGTPTGIVTVVCSPPAGNTMTATGSILISGDTDNTTAPTFKQITHNLSCIGGASVLALAPANSIDFGLQLVNVPTATQTLTMTNNGTSAANINFTSTSANRFRFDVKANNGATDCGYASFSDCSLAASGGTITITATFLPTTEGTVSASYSVANSNGPGSGFILTGRGADRRIELPESVQFEDTFRNPGSKAPVKPVRIHNGGEWPIHVEELLLQSEGNPPFWSIVEPIGAFDVPSLGDVDVLIRFAPVEAGKVTDGQLLIRNDDLKLASGMPIVLMSGNGKDRKVQMAPGAVNLGDTFAGVATRLSVVRPDELLTITNREEPDELERQTDFEIREVTITGPYASMFDVVDLEGNSLDGRTLAATEILQADIVFTPAYPGEFEAVLNLYLDEDTRPLTVPVRGRALYVSARGSGGFGCQATSSSRAAMLLVIGTFALILRRRRR